VKTKLTFQYFSPPFVSDQMQGKFQKEQKYT